MGTGTMVSITLPIVRTTPEVEHRVRYGGSQRPDDDRQETATAGGAGREPRTTTVDRGPTEGTGGSE